MEGVWNMKELLTYGKGPRAMSVTPTPCANGQSTHTIRRGETLAGIANAYALTLDELLAANPGVDPYAYHAGDVLCIPSPPSPNCCDGRLYCVQMNDTAAGISEMFGITESELAEANPILLQTGLIPGQIICIPAAPPLPQPLCPGAVDQIIITQGATFADVLLAYNISFNALQVVNPDVDLANLSIGQSLCIPERDSRGTCRLCETVYTLAEGDTLESLTEALGVTVGELMMKNPTMLSSDFAQGAMICL